jgi:hypothetical protein
MAISRGQLSKGKKVIRHEDIWGSGGIAPPFSTSALYEGKVLPFHLVQTGPGA